MPRLDRTGEDADYYALMGESAELRFARVTDHSRWRKLELRVFAGVFSTA